MRCNHQLSMMIWQSGLSGDAQMASSAEQLAQHNAAGTASWQCLRASADGYEVVVDIAQKTSEVCNQNQWCLVCSWLVRNVGSVSAVLLPPHHLTLRDSNTCCESGVLNLQSPPTRMAFVTTRPLSASQLITSVGTTKLLQLCRALKLRYWRWLMLLVLGSTAPAVVHLMTSFRLATAR